MAELFDGLEDPVIAVPIEVAESVQVIAYFHNTFTVYVRGLQVSMTVTRADLGVLLGTGLLFWRSLSQRFQFRYFQCTFLPMVPASTS